MKNLILSGLLAFAIIGCTPSAKHSKEDVATGPAIIDLEQARQVEKSLKLSDIAAGIEYIKLETSPAGLLRQPISIYKSCDYFFIEQRGQTLQFTDKGKFCRSLYPAGRGPGETFGRCLAIDDSAKQVYVYGNFSSKINRYSFDGNHLGTDVIEENDPFYFLNQMIAWKNHYITISDIGGDIPEDFLKTYSLPGFKLQQAYENPYKVELNKRLQVVTSNLMVVQDRGAHLLVKEKFNDTIYYTNDCKKYVPQYIINTGSGFRSFEETVKMYAFETKIMVNSSVIERVYETGRFLFITERKLLPKSHVDYLYVFDKQNRVTYKHPDLSIKNDMDSTVDFRCFDLLNAWSKDNQLFMFVYPYDLMDETVQGASAKMQQLTQGLSESDNPYIMVVNLKK